MQVLIGRDQRTRLEAIARRRGTSVATLVREAIDRSFPDNAEARRRSSAEILAAEAMQVPDVADLLAELDEIRNRRS